MTDGEEYDAGIVWTPVVVYPATPAQRRALYRLLSPSERGKDLVRRLTAGEAHDLLDVLVRAAGRVDPEVPPDPDESRS
jgi:hypothetical protein